MRLPAFVCLCLSVCQQDYSTSSSAVTKRSRDASCLSASTIQNVEQSLLFQLRRHGSLQICHCMQLNALFCCVWRNVEASCHKHFVVFFRNQHRRLLPAMHHNLRHTGRAPPATAFTTPAYCSVNTGSQARYRLRIAISAYPTSIRRPRYGSSRRNITMSFRMEKLE